MHRCRHDLEEDPYASGAENRRENRDRLNRDVALHDRIKQAIKGGYGSPYGGYMGMPGMLAYPHGLGYGGYVPGPLFSPYSGHYGYPGFPGPYGKGVSLPLYTDDYDAKDDCPSTWYYPPPPHPHFTVSPLLTSSRPRRSQFGGHYNLRLPSPWTGAFEHEHYHIPPRPFISHMGCRH